MLNELHTLASVLKERGIITEVWHKDFKANPKTATFRILIDSAGDLSGIEIIKEDKAKTAIKKWETSNGNSFPSFNVEPLFNLTHSESATKEAAALKKKLDKKENIDLNAVKALAEQAINHWENETRIGKKLNKCLSHIPNDMEKIIIDPLPEYQALLALTQRIQKTTAEQFHQQLSDLILAQDNLLPFFELLFFYTGAKAKNTCLVLEVVDRSEFEYPANHSETQSWFNTCLLESQKKAVILEDDAYGAAKTGWDEKFAAVRMNILGDVTLRAMNNESRCQYRYGQIDAKGNPVGIETRQAMTGALAWLSHPDRRGKTWTDISRSRNDSALLFAYPTIMPKQLPQSAMAMGGGVTNKDSDGVGFEVCSTQVVKSLTTIPVKITARMQIFVLSKPDGFRTKIQSHHQCSIDRFIEASQGWQRGSKNIPLILIGGFKDKKPYWQLPIAPFPEQVVWCLNTVWTHFGTQANTVNRFTMGDALDLFLDTKAKLKVTVNGLLSILIKNNRALLLALGNAHHGNRIHPVAKNYHEQPLLLPSILGLFLYKLDIHKEVYMSSPAFLIGRLLSIADQLHDKYCKYVRKDSKPSQLLGNALMATALEHPEQALAMFSQRILPYQAWAKTYSGEEAGLVHYFLNEWGTICHHLAEIGIPEHCNDTDKATMLLGYLAMSKKKDKQLTSIIGESNE
jgi:hypothetical protein